MDIISNREPATEGRYLAFVADDVTKIYARPIVLMWDKGWWYYPTSSVRYSPKVYGWFGPLPVGKLTELFPPRHISVLEDLTWIEIKQPEYDL